MTNFMTFYDVLCQWNKETEIVIECRKLSSHPLCEQNVEALKQENKLVATHAAHSLGLLGEFGRLDGVSPRSAGPIFGVHSA